MVHASSALTAALFFKIWPKAGLMVAPFAAWTGFYTLLMYHIHQEESKQKSA